VGNGYGTVLIAWGYSALGVLPALVEGLSNMILSVLGMILIGPAGVAWATLDRSRNVIISVIIIFVVPRITELSLDRQTFIRQGIYCSCTSFFNPSVAGCFAAVGSKIISSRRHSAMVSIGTLLAVTVGPNSGWGPPHLSRHQVRVEHVPNTTVLCAVKRCWSTAGESPVRELVRSAR